MESKFAVEKENFFEGSGVISLNLERTDSHKLFAVTYKPDLKDQDNFYISYDLGENWNLLSLPIKDLHGVYCLQNGRVLAFNQSNLFVSEDGLNDWKKIGNGLPQDYFFSSRYIAIDSKGRIIIRLKEKVNGSYKSSFYYSIDQGDTFSVLSYDVGDNFVAGTDCYFIDEKEENVFSSGSYKIQGAFSQYDRGAIWKIDINNQSRTLFYKSEQNSVISMLVDPIKDGIAYFIVGSDIYSLSDNFSKVEKVLTAPQLSYMNLWKPIDIFSKYPLVTAYKKEIIYFFDVDNNRLLEGGKFVENPVCFTQVSENKIFVGSYDGLYVVNR